jgi:hypothetical protein
MVEARKFFSVYSSFFIVYVPVFLVCRFFTVFVFGTGWKMGILEWILVGAIVVIFLQFLVTIFIPKTMLFFGEKVFNFENPK